VARKKGKLGKTLNVTPHCYAAVIGGCGERFTQEHPLSKNLRKGKSLQIVGSILTPDGWQQGFSVDVTIEQAAAAILCDIHNGALSLADTEGGKLSAALREARERMASPIARAPISVPIDGTRFGRWLCKYYAGCLAMTGRIPHPDFVRYAFGQPTERRIYFLFAGRVGDAPPIGDTRNMPLRVFSTEPGGPEAFRVTFEGWDIVVSTFPPDAPEMAEVIATFAKGTQFMDRLKVLNLAADGVRINLDWDSDPDELRILDASGLPVSSRR
jgi:hypothetical protein